VFTSAAAAGDTVVKKVAESFDHRMTSLNENLQFTQLFQRCTENVTLNNDDDNVTISLSKQFHGNQLDASESLVCSRTTQNISPVTCHKAQQTMSAQTVTNMTVEFHLKV